jgi:hypothetical protein
MINVIRRPKQNTGSVGDFPELISGVRHGQKRIGRIHRGVRRLGHHLSLRQMQTQRASMRGANSSVN